MKLFACQSCGQHLYFENVACTRCGHRLGFLPDLLEVSALEAAGDPLWRAVGKPAEGHLYRMCTNYSRYAVCNWMIPAHDPDPFCSACRLNRTIPDLSVPGNLALWQTLEKEKRRLIYGLERLQLPVRSQHEDPEGLAFDFLADTEPSFRETNRVMTGHFNGLITINIAEADPATRERMRQSMAEPYRTILGHFRHESGHYYWDRLVRGRPWLAPFRQTFGNETADYRQALERHHRDGPPPDWQNRFVSAYASSHPWEDWAESWAHYLHIIDTLETAQQSGVQVRPRIGHTDPGASTAAFDPYAPPDFGPILAHWLPLADAMNNLNRSMGHDHAYPFVLAAPAIEKLGFIHRIVQAQRSRP